MATNIHVRAVDDDLADAARRRADETHRSLSAYVRDLIADDLERAQPNHAMRALLSEIATDPNRGQVSHGDVLDALHQTRSEMGVA